MCTDGTAALVREQFPDATLIELGQNLGFGRAVNRAAGEGDAEAIVVLNNDVNVESSFLAEIVAPLEDASVGMVAGVLLDSESGLIDAAGVEIDAGLAGYAYMGGLPLSALGRPAEGMLGPCGGAAAYRRSAFNGVGGFDERIFAYSEDLEIALRFRAAGWRCELAAGARGVHLGSATLGARTVEQARHAARSRGYVLGRYRVNARWLAAESAVATTATEAVDTLMWVGNEYQGVRDTVADYAGPKGSFLNTYVGRMIDATPFTAGFAGLGALDDCHGHTAGSGALFVSGARDFAARGHDRMVAGARRDSESAAVLDEICRGGWRYPGGHLSAGRAAPPACVGSSPRRGVDGRSTA